MRKHGTMSGQEYELSCIRYLKARGFREIELTPASGDQGIDILATKKKIRYGIQCKYYSHPVGNKAVQEAYSGAAFYDCDVPVVMTNTGFTASATELADTIGVMLWDGIEGVRSLKSPLLVILRIAATAELIICAWMIRQRFFLQDTHIPVIAILLLLTGILLVFAEGAKTARILTALLCHLGFFILAVMVILPKLPHSSGSFVFTIAYLILLSLLYIRYRRVQRINTLLP